MTRVADPNPVFRIRSAPDPAFIIRSDLDQISGLKRRSDPNTVIQMWPDPIPNPVFKIMSDPDPVFKNWSDPDPQPCL